jgi:hypothetical protein
MLHVKIKLLRYICSIMAAEIGQVELAGKSRSIKNSGGMLTEVPQIIQRIGTSPEREIPEISP